MTGTLDDLAYLEQIAKKEPVVDPVTCPGCGSINLFRIKSFGRCISCGAVIAPTDKYVPEVYRIPWEEFSRIPEYGKNVRETTTQK